MIELVVGFVIAAVLLIAEYIRFLYKGIIINHNKKRANLH